MRRRRIAAGLTLCAVAAIGVAAAVAFTGGGGSSRAKREGATTTTTSSPKPPAERKRKAKVRKSEQARQKALALSADRAAARFAELGYPLYCGGTHKNVVALTFDDGPATLTDQGVLRVLGNRHAHATFFILGRHIQNYPLVVRKELRFGAVGNHTWNHASLTGLNAFAIKSELGDTQRQLEQTTGRPIRLFRPPYGAHGPKVDELVRSYGMLEVLWSVDSHDWKGLSSDAIIQRVVGLVGPGSIVLMHDIHENTVEGLPKLIRKLRRRGYRLLSVPEMLVVDPPSQRQLSLGAGGCS